MVPSPSPRRPGPTRCAGVAAAAALVGALGCHGAALQWQEARAQDPEPSGPRYLRNYKEAHFRDLGDRFSGSLDAAAFRQQLRNARVVYLGDHHTDRALHERYLDLLVDLHRHAIPFDLGLECVGEQDEPAVEAYLGGELGFDATVRTIGARWPEHWFDRDEVDSAFYRALLRQAPAWGAGVFALEPTPRLPLYARDQTIARRVRDRAAATPRLLVVLVGHTHLLGQGQLIRRVDLPHVAIGARLSVGLIDAAGQARFPADHRFARTASGVWFTLPLDTSVDTSD